MENQHRKISGYRELDEHEVKKMNEIKAHGANLKIMIDELKKMDVDQRWVSIAETHLQQGIMAAVRSVAQPDGF